MSAQRQKGTAFETLIVNYLQTMGFPEARRLGMQGAKDKGDIGGLGRPVTLELKCCATLSLGGWMSELEAEMHRAGHVVGAVVHKRRGKGNPASQYVTMDLASLVALLKGVS